MKRVVLAVLMLGSLSTLASAGNFPMAGCGLGYIAFGHQKNDKFYQVLSATVNDIVSPKTSAITSGTSGCTEDGAVKLVKQVEVFAELNLESLKKEMAQGQGEFVTTFAQLLGADEKVQPQLVAFFQSEYSNLFPSANTTAIEMLQNLQQSLNQHPDLIG